MSRNSNLNQWRGAVPLASAWETFASKKELADLASSPDFNSKLSEELSLAVASKDPAFVKILKPFSTATAARLKRKSLIEGMCESLLDALFNEQLWAFGYRKRPSRSSYPVRIEADFFDGANVELINSTAENFGLVYADIRVCDALLKSPLNSNSRKGSADAICAAIAQLVAGRQDFCDLRSKTQCELIRQTLGQHYVSGNGLSNENLSKLILLQCPKRAIQSEFK